MRIVLILVLLLFSGIAQAITEQEARDIVDTIFAGRFGANYMKNVLFYDGTVFRVGYALARSGSVPSGGCGYNLVNTAIAITFDMAADSAGASEEGTTIFRMDPPAIATLYIAQCMVEDFLEATVQGQAGVAGMTERADRVSERPLVIQNPIHGRILSLYLSDVEIPLEGSLRIYDVLGRQVGFSIINQGRANLSPDLSPGLYLVEVRSIVRGNVQRLRGRFILLE